MPFHAPDGVAGGSAHDAVPRHMPRSGPLCAGPAARLAAEVSESGGRISGAWDSGEPRRNRKCFGSSEGPWELQDAPEDPGDAPEGALEKH